MNKNNLAKSVFSALILASTIVSADEKYPAADFKPEVVYQDNDYISKNTNATKATPAKASTPSAKPAEAVEVDSKYPAADFKPQVVYHDTDYKPSKSSNSAVANNVADETSSTSSESAADVKKDDSSANFLIGLIALAGVGFYFFKSQGSSKKSSPKRPARAHAAVNPNGLTGVAKYVNKVSGTGVSRYVAKNAIAAKVKKTGVANYVARQKAAKATTTGSATGVEKYMRDRG